MMVTVLSCSYPPPFWQLHLHEERTPADMGVTQRYNSRGLTTFSPIKSRAYWTSNTILQQWRESDSKAGKEDLSPLNEGEKLYMRRQIGVAPDHL
ncbi:unnamed protein product [Strongylus vulgaris]|uniref:Uncharacterized protein n=1 Tax=Strongylus vulgaris TaxID=40348 RepID=A0A3P7INJ5_STRVU|nr:unnamed protein product [Strongylus vulgaris]